MRRHHHLIIAAAVAGAALFTGAASAFAGTFQVEPTRAHLEAGRATSMVTITNTSDTGVRFQVSASAWSQADDGSMVLAETRDLVVYPTLFEIPAGQSQAIRIGTTAEIGAMEKAYRIFVQELPPLRRAGEGQQIRVLTRMGIPVFLAPRSVRINGEVNAVSLHADRVALTVANFGTRHFRVGQVRVTGRDAGGAVVFERQVPGWYVLAGLSRRFEVPLEAGEAARTSAISIAAESDGGTWLYQDTGQR